MSEQGESFAFKSAALGAQGQYQMTPTGLERRDGKGVVVEEIAWIDIRSGRYSSRIVRQIHFAYFDLYGLNGQRLRVACSAPLGSWDREADSRAFNDLIEALLEALRDKASDIEITLGDGGGWRWAWFGLGLAMAAFGIGLPIIAYLEGVDSDRLLTVTPVMGLMGLFGAYLAWGHRPWKPPTRVGVTAFLDAAPALLKRVDRA